MGLRVSNLRRPVEEPEAELPRHLAHALGIPPADLGPWRIVRKALDLRDKSHLRFVYNFEVEAPATLKPNRNRHEAVVEVHDEPPFAMPKSGEQRLAERPVVV